MEKECWDEKLIKEIAILSGSKRESLPNWSRLEHKSGEREPVLIKNLPDSHWAVVLAMVGRIVTSMLMLMSTLARAEVG